MTTTGDIIVASASGVPRRLAAGTSGQVLQISSGSPVWGAGGGGGGFNPYPTLAPPLSANFSFLNPNSYGVSVTDKTDRMLVQIPAGSLGVALMQTAALPSPPYTIDVGVSVPGVGAIALVNLALKNSAGNALRTYGPRLDSGNVLFYMQDQSWTSVTSPGTQNSTVSAVFSLQSIYFWRITDDGTNRKIYWSNSFGKDFSLFLSQASGTGVNPDRIGMVFYNSGATLEIVSVYHWLISNSILPQFAN
jgi:hypothetical protein